MNIDRTGAALLIAIVALLLSVLTYVVPGSKASRACLDFPVLLDRRGYRVR